MRLQRGKLERERQKHIAEHAFDYTAPPAPKNIQAISQLALPTSSRVLSAKNKSATSVQRASGEGQKTSVGFRGAVQNIDGNQRQPARPGAGTQHPTQHPAQHHMSPAVAAALAKYQVTQGALAQAVVPATMAKENFEAAGNLVHQLDEATISSQYWPSPYLSHLPTTVSQYNQGPIQEHQDLAGQLQPSEAADYMSTLHATNKTLSSHVVNEATTDIRASFEQEIVEPRKEIENEEQNLTTTTSICEDAVDANDGKAAQIMANSLQQFVMLLNFDDNRYGDDDVERGASPTLQSHIKTLPNAEIGGSSSLEEFASSSRESLPSGSPKDPKSVAFRLKLPLKDDDATSAIIQLETDAQTTQHSTSCRAATRFYEAAVNDDDVLRRVALLMSDMEEWMAAHNDADRIQTLALWSDCISQELLDIPHLSDEMMEFMQAGHAAIVHSLTVSLQRATARDLDGCVSISGEYLPSNESPAHEILSGH